MKAFDFTTAKTARQRSSRSMSVTHGAAQMFDLVADVERYPEFVPLCLGAHVRHRAASAVGVETLIAEMRVGLGALTQSFTTRDTLDRSNLRITIVAVEGPFRHFENVWAFHPGVDANGCRMEFSADYEFSNPILAGVMARMFELQFRKIAAAFEARADAIYGRGRTSIPDVRS